MKRLIPSFLLLAFVFTTSAKAQELSELQLFYRCYSHITDERPKTNLPELLSVKNGTSSAVDACLQVLNRASLVSQGGTRISDINDLSSVSVLRTFHNLHSSWFQKKDFSIMGEEALCYGHALGDLFDVSAPALFYTKALLKSNTNFSSILTGTDGLEALREEQEPVLGAISKQNTSYFLDQRVNSGDPLNLTVWTQARKAPTGTMYGVRQALPLMAPVLRTEFIGFSAPNYKVEDLNLDIKKSLGGGLLGTQEYLLMNGIIGGSSHAPDDVHATGTVEVSRLWSKAVYEDLLCRELPLVRLTDSQAGVAPNSSVTFRNAANCVQCHVSMDQMANAVRNIKHATGGRTGDTCNSYRTPKENTLRLVYEKQSSEPTEGDVWLSEPDDDFDKRPAFGRLYYRGTEGKLVNKRVNGLEELGQALLAEDDIYICAAKRYLRHFTGMNANVNDLNDPLNQVILNEKDQAIRNYVISLGKKLKSHQDMKLMIKDIIESPLYRDLIYFNGSSNSSPNRQLSSIKEEGSQ